MEEPLLRNPAAAVHEVPLHDGDLAGRAAEADEAQPDPVAEGLPETDPARALRRAVQRPAIEKSSNWMTESAFVQRPTRPGPWKLSSVASRTFVPSNQIVASGLPPCSFARSRRMPP